MADRNEFKAIESERIAPFCEEHDQAIVAEVKGFFEHPHMENIRSHIEVTEDGDVKFDFYALCCILGYIRQTAATRAKAALDALTEEQRDGLCNLDANLAFASFTNVLNKVDQFTSAVVTQSLIDAGHEVKDNRPNPMEGLMEMMKKMAQAEGEPEPISPEDEERVKDLLGLAEEPADPTA